MIGDIAMIKIGNMLKAALSVGTRSAEGNDIVVMGAIDTIIGTRAMAQFAAPLWSLLPISCRVIRMLSETFEAM